MSIKSRPAVDTAASARPVVLWCGVNVLVTTVHHVYGAIHFDTPDRYGAVVIAAAALALAVTALAISRTGSRMRGAARWTFRLVSALAFVVMFGLVEGLATHVIVPIADQGYPADEPFDLIFQATGILHVVPAAFTAYYLLRKEVLPCP